MKTLLSIALAMFTVQAFADRNDSFSRQERERDRQLFASMTAQDALMSDEFDRITYNQYLPNTSSWYNPRSLCVDGNLLRTKVPVRSCSLYEVRNDDDRIVHVRDYFDAREISGNHPKCVEYTSAYVSAPINYSARECSRWQYSDDGEQKTTTSASRARDEGARCIESQVVAKRTPTAFQVDFFTGGPDHQPGDRHGRDHLGSHTYAIPQCGGVELPPIPAF